MTLPDIRNAPPLWKAVVVYYAAILAVFAVLGVIGAGGHPAGAVTGIGIVLLSHFVPLAAPPPVAPLAFLAIAAAAIAVLWIALRLLRSWWRIAFVIFVLLAWLGMGLARLGAAA